MLQVNQRVGVPDPMAQLDNGWNQVKTEGIAKLEHFLTGGGSIEFSKKEYMRLYTNVYDLSTTQNEYFASELYRRYTESIQTYLQSQIVPLLANLTGAQLLTQLELRWKNH